MERSCEAEATKRCNVCKAVFVLLAEHQRAHRKTHKVECHGSAKCGASGGRAAGGAATVEGNDAGEEDEGEGGDEGERTATRDRCDAWCDELEANMKEGGFELRALEFALGALGW